MQAKEFYPIGTTGKKWQDAEYQSWRDHASIKRDYHKEVVTKIHALTDRFKVEQYGALSYDLERYPLFCIKSNNWESNKPVVLITGGVHGYETSGVHGALQFVDTQMENYSKYFNIMVAPCISPWGYETINRWNPLAIDPNRSFYADSPAEESANLIKLVNSVEQTILVHFDLHETTDTDETEFRPALAARDGADFTPGIVPDGFYTVGDSENPQPDFQTAVIKSVSDVTHIAPADQNAKIIGSPVIQKGVINYPMAKLGLCGGVTNSIYSTTTEVYPDSPKVTAEECNQAQVAAIKGGLDYVLTKI
ncbi:M14 family metallopeptidase [Vibrio pectenicida]|uniref:Peptidase n=1 Tax=Vibrio pectenicida TaxID=62763 RepID=A0A3R9L2J0_9VIBR|nr:M14 family metallocarboxypeptidase [Vibrio pectenicida]RSD31498.1 peptidase [Vibrio pectenicida]